MDKELAVCFVVLYFSRFQITIFVNAKLAIIFELRLIPGRNYLQALLLSYFLPG